MNGPAWAIAIVAVVAIAYLAALVWIVRKPPSRVKTRVALVMLSFGAICILAGIATHSGPTVSDGLKVSTVWGGATLLASSDETGKRRIGWILLVLGLLSSMARPH